MAVFLLGGLLAFAPHYSRLAFPAAPTVGILGGVAEAVSAPQGQGAPHVVAYSPVVPTTPSNQAPLPPQETFPGAAVDSGLSREGFNRSDLIIYKVQKGDSLYGIASYFGVSLDTLINANPSVRAGFLRVGDELNILPISGVVYKTQEGDTLESISALFGVSEDNIRQFNKSVNFGSLGAGLSLVIPGGKRVAYNSSRLPDLRDHFIKPAEGFNWGKLHPHNAIDIANTCGTSVVAAAEGLVIPDVGYGDGRGGWNGGYGNFVLIEHPFGSGVKTRYAHLKEVTVSIGEYVKQGDQVGLMGETGEATGCHVHFEVYGAENPFVK